MIARHAWSATATSSRPRRKSGSRERSSTRGFPANAIRYCLQEGGISLADLKYFVFYDKPLIKFERLLETYVAFSPKGIKSFLAAMPVWLKEKILMKSVLQDELVSLDGVKKSGLPPILFGEHHESHAASAFYPSPFNPRRFYAWTAWASGRQLQHGWARAIR